MDRFEALKPSELDWALPYLLAPAAGAEPVTSGHLDNFRDYLAENSLEWQGVRCGPAHDPTGLFFAVLLPGGTAIIMVAAPQVGRIDPADQLSVISAGLDRLRGRRLHYAQALLEPQAVGKRDLLVQAGFRRLAALVYLERAAKYPWVDPPEAGAAEWISYDERNRARFAQVVLATYESSQDCPELAGLRPIDDILAAHRSSGPFEPRLWELASVDGQPAGCLLLARLARGALLEVVYMGVVPTHRRRGVGALLLRRALERCRALGTDRITVVVDDRNEPAKRLYDRFGFTARTRRDAYLYRWEQRDRA